jgi:hypothetical protein
MCICVCVQGSSAHATSHSPAAGLRVSWVAGGVARAGQGPLAAPASLAQAAGQPVAALLAQAPQDPTTVCICRYLFVFVCSNRLRRVFVCICLNSAWVRGFDGRLSQPYRLRLLQIRLCVYVCLNINVSVCLKLCTCVYVCTFVCVWVGKMGDCRSPIGSGSSKSGCARVFSGYLIYGCARV